MAATTAATAAASLTSQWSVSFSSFRFHDMQTRRDTIRTVDVVLIITVNCEFCQALQRRWCLPFFWEIAPVCFRAFCMCLFEQRLYTSGCLLFAKEPLSHIYSMFRKTTIFYIRGFTCKAAIWKCSHLHVGQCILGECQPLALTSESSLFAFDIISQRFSLLCITVWWQHLIVLTWAQRSYESWVMSHFQNVSDWHFYERFGEIVWWACATSHRLKKATLFSPS